MRRKEGGVVGKGPWLVGCGHDRGTSCTSCRFRRGRDRFGRLCPAGGGPFVLAAGSSPRLRVILAGCWGWDVAAGISPLTAWMRNSRSKRIGLDPIHHGREHVEPFPLILDERVFLSIPAQTDAIPKLIHAEKVVFPVMVDHLQEQHFFQIAEQVRAEFLFLAPVGVQHSFPNLFPQGIPAHFFQIGGGAGSSLAITSCPN